jgi:hypothetical protein
MASRSRGRAVIKATSITADSTSPVSVSCIISFSALPMKARMYFYLLLLLTHETLFFSKKYNAMVR